MSLLAFAQGDDVAAGRAGLLASAILTAGPRLTQTVNAAGLIGGLFPGSTALVTPLLILDPAHVDPVFGGPQVPGEGPVIMPFGELRRFHVFADVVRVVGGNVEDWLPEVAVWLLPPLSPSAAPGSGIYHATTGTLGFPVVWPGQRGFLTAGHVCRSATGPVRENAPPMNPIVGNVAYVADPHGKGAAPCEDIAVIALTGGSAVPPPSPFGSRSTMLVATDRVMIWTTRGTLHDSVRAAVAFYYTATPAMTGTWGECYMTMSGVTVPGDSGAAVVSAANAPVGTVVAGTQGLADLVQKIDYQLQQTGIAGLSLA